MASIVRKLAGFFDHPNLPNCYGAENCAESEDFHFLSYRIAFTHFVVRRNTCDDLDGPE